MDKRSTAPGQDVTAGRHKWLLEALVLVWSLAGLGYFYYTQFLQPLWTQFFG